MSKQGAHGLRDLSSFAGNSEFDVGRDGGREHDSSHLATVEAGRGKARGLVVGGCLEGQVGAFVHALAVMI